MLLAASAGYLDAFVFLHVTATFVANMSGNLIRVGMGVGDGTTLVPPLVALAAFCAGAIVATSALDHQVRSAAELAHPSPLLAAEACLLALVALWLRRIGLDHDTYRATRDLPAIVTAAAAMGVQTVSIRAVGETVVSTTYGTGALVRLSEKIALSLRRAPRPTDAPRRDAIMVLAAVLASYVLGAAAGAHAPSTPLALVVPVSVALGSSAWLRRGAPG